MFDTTEAALYIERMTYAARIIQKLGGTRPTAALLELPVSTIQSWKTTGRIPDKRKAYVMERAAERGIKFRKSDFFPLEDGA